MSGSGVPLGVFAPLGSLGEGGALEPAEGLDGLPVSEVCAVGTSSPSLHPAAASRPSIARTVSVDVPPAEISGSWIPVTGSNPMT